ncbi:hypothetical protein MASR2M54_16430 [Aliarcobacter cryaerophilus]
MDNLVLEYRDPIIGIILLVFMIFLISFLHTRMVFTKKNLQEKIIENYLVDLN